MKFNTWLVQQLNSLVSVQRTSPVLVIHMWSGVKVQVHLVDQSVKIRALKRVLQDSGDIGLGSLFLVDATMLPQDGQRANIPDWLLALHVMNHERIYAYRLMNNSFEVFQMHFESIISSTEYKIWHGPKVEFDKLRFFRVSVKHKLIKGDWLIADFGASAFWKNNDYRNYRTQQDKTYYANRQTHWEDWSGYQTWSGNYERGSTNTGNGNGSKSPMGDYLQACYQILGVEASTPQNEVKRAFRKLAISFHPDTSELPAKEAEEKFRALNAAYEYVKAAKGWS